MESSEVPCKLFETVIEDYGGMIPHEYYHHFYQILRFWGAFKLGFLTREEVNDKIHFHLDKMDEWSRLLNETKIH